MHSFLVITFCCEYRVKHSILLTAVFCLQRCWEVFAAAQSAQFCICAFSFRRESAVLYCQCLAHNRKGKRSGKKGLSRNAAWASGQLEETSRHKEPKDFWHIKSTMEKDITKTNQKSSMEHWNVSCRVLHPASSPPLLMKVFRTGICTAENFRC